MSERPTSASEGGRGGPGRSLQHPLRRFRLPGLLVAGVILYGISGYMLIEGWNLLDSFYMVIITISTVGFTEVHPLGSAGRLFTSSLIIFGVGTMLYSLGLFAELIVEGHLGAYSRQRRMEERVRGLRDHYILCGYGRIGTQVVTEFERAKVAYIVIDNNPDAVARLEREGRLHLDADASAEEVLKEAGIERARGLVAAVDSDERVVYIVLAARALNPELFVVARAGQPASVRRLELAGADRVISPYRMAGHHMAELALRPALLDVMEFLQHGDDSFGVEELTVRPGSRASGRRLGETGLLEEQRAQVLALRVRDGTVHANPSPEMVLNEGDILIAVGSAEQLGQTAELLQ